MPLSLWHRCCANAFLDAIGVVVMCSGSRCPAPSPRAHTSATGQHADLEYSTVCHSVPHSDAPLFPTSTRRFPRDLPRDCPPSNATLRHQAVYRIVKAAPPTREDFRTHAELGTATRADPCRRAALSVFSTWRQARHRQMSSPHLGGHIAKASLTPRHGPISQPQTNGHMDWWPFDDMPVPSDFEVTTHDH